MTREPVQERTGAETQPDPAVTRIEGLSKGFEKLAFTIASKMGSLQRVMNEMNDRFKRFESMMLDVSSFEQQFRKMAGSFHAFESKLDDIKSSVSAMRVSQQCQARTESLPATTQGTDTRDRETTTSSLLARVRTLLKEPGNPEILANRLDEVKRQAFSRNGGSVMLYKLGDEIKRLRMESRNDPSFSLETFTRDLDARVDEWLSSMDPGLRP